MKPSTPFFLLILFHEKDASVRAGTGVSILDLVLALLANEEGADSPYPLCYFR